MRGGCCSIPANPIFDPDLAVFPLEGPTVSTVPQMTQIPLVSGDEDSAAFPVATTDVNNQQVRVENVL